MESNVPGSRRPLAIPANSRGIGRVEAVRRDIVRKVRQVGVITTIKQGTLKLVREFCGGSGRDHDARPDEFDLQYGTDTGRIVSVGSLDIPDDRLAHVIRYETVSPEVFSESMALLEICHQDFVFIDLGSGKGRALLLAARFPFKEIIGVEISNQLHTIALQNISVFVDDLQRCPSITSICQDVLDFEFPEENIVVYLYNPFDDHLMRPLVAKVADFVCRSGKSVFVVYQNPLYRDIWELSKSFQAIKVTNRCVVFKSCSPE